MGRRHDQRAIERLADEELMVRVDEKDPAAFEVFYDRHGGAGYSLAHRIVGDRSGAEDVTQEAFLSIWRSSARYDPARGSVRSWTLGIVRNRAIDALRRASGPAPKLDLDDEVLLEGRPAAELTDSEVIRRDVAERVRGARDDLAAYALGALGEAEAGELETHLAGCAECRRYLDELRPGIDLLAASVPQLPPPAALRERLVATVNAEAVRIAEAARPAAPPR